MELEQAIRTRRTQKAFRRDRVPRELLDELFDLARWAPAQLPRDPWRFRVVGPQALAALKEAAAPVPAPKLDRAPTLVPPSVVQTVDQVQAAQRLLARRLAS